MHVTWRAGIELRIFFCSNTNTVSTFNYLCNPYARYKSAGLLVCHSHHNICTRLSSTFWKSFLRAEVCVRMHPREATWTLCIQTSTNWVQHVKRHAELISERFRVFNWKSWLKTWSDFLFWCSINLLLRLYLILESISKSCLVVGRKGCQWLTYLFRHTFLQVPKCRNKNFCSCFSFKARKSLWKRKQCECKSVVI